MHEHSTRIRGKRGPPTGQTDHGSMTPQQTGFCVLRKMISQKKVKNNAVYNVLKVAWVNYGPVKMTDLEEGIMVFEFENGKDRACIMDMSPWVVH